MSAETYRRTRDDRVYTIRWDRHGGRNYAVAARESNGVRVEIGFPVEDIESVVAALREAAAQAREMTAAEEARHAQALLGVPMRGRR